MVSVTDQSLMKRAPNTEFNGALYDNTPTAKIVRVLHETMKHWNISFVSIDKSCYCTELDGYIRL